MVPLSFSLRPEARAKSRSTVSPTARITESHSKRWISSVGTGLRRPDASYSPSRVFTISIAFTFPLASPTIRCGAARNSELHALVLRAASVSSSIAGMSLRSRR